MPRTDLLLPTGAIKYGIVTVFNADRTVNRMYRITAQELADKPNGIAPPGCTQQEWESGLVTIGGRTNDVGDVAVLPDESVVLKLAEDQVGNLIVFNVVRLAKGEYTGTPPRISVSAGVLAAIDLRATKLAVLTSIQDGVVQWQSR